MPHGGAAGGLPAGLFATFDNVKVVSGIEYIINLTGLEALIAAGALVITGEGRYDEQSKCGKVIGKLMEISPDLTIICGQNTTDETSHIFDLISRFGLAKSMEETQECFVTVIEEIWTALLRH